MAVWYSSNSRNFFRHPSIAIEIQPPPLSLTLPPKPHPKSIGSKLQVVATFGRSRLPKPSRTEPLAAQPSAFSVSTSRPTSYESGSSCASWPRSSTPRPSQPLITVSLSPNDLSEYKNLFTRPPPRDSDITPSPTRTPPPNSCLPKSDSPIYPKRGQAPASAIAIVHRQATCDGDDRSPSRSESSRYSRKNSDSDKGHEDTPGPSGAQETPLATPDGEKGPPLSLQRHPSPVTTRRSVQSSENVNLPSIRSCQCMKLPSNPIRSRPRKDKELKGLRWIINNGDSSQLEPSLSTGVLNHSLLSATSTLSESEDNSRIIPGVSRRLY